MPTVLAQFQQHPFTLLLFTLAHLLTPSASLVLAGCAAGWIAPRNVEYQLPPPTGFAPLLSFFSAKLKKETQQQPHALFIQSPLYLVGSTISPLFFSGGLDLLLTYLIYLFIVTRIITTPTFLPACVCVACYPDLAQEEEEELVGQGPRAAGCSASNSGTAGRSKSISENK